MRRFVWIVSLVGWLCSSTALSDIVIFRDGSRMEVQSYEIKGGLVLIKTLEGKLQSIPGTYVDLQATERANRGEPAPAPPRSVPSEPPPKPAPTPAPPMREETPSEPAPERPSGPPAKPPAPTPRPESPVPPPVWSDDELQVSIVIPSAVWQVETQSASFDVAVRLDNPQTGARATLALVRERLRNYGDFQDVVRDIESSVASSSSFQGLGSNPLFLDPYTAHEIRYLKDINGTTYYNQMVVYYSRDLAYVLSLSCPEDTLKQNEADFEGLVKGVVIKKVRKDITPKGAPRG